MGVNNQINMSSLSCGVPLVSSQTLIRLASLYFGLTLPHSVDFIAD